MRRLPRALVVAALLVASPSLVSQSYGWVREEFFSSVPASTRVLIAVEATTSTNAAAAAAAPASTPAPASTLAPRPAPRRQSRPGPPPKHATETLRERVLQRIHYPYRGRLAAEFPIKFLGPRPGLLGATRISVPFDPAAVHGIEIYVRPGQPIDDIALVTAYEIGHAIDSMNNTAESRAAWLHLRGAKRANPWFPPCDLCNEDPYGSGDFSDVFAHWVTGSTESWSTDVAPPPSREMMGRLISFFREPAVSARDSTAR